MSRFRRFALLFALAVPFAAGAHETAVNTLMTKPLEDLPGKEALMLLVDYPPGGKDTPHRHDAHAFIYVLEGSIVMRLGDGEETTLAAGETFYEGPGDVHTVGRNASATEPAKFLVVFLKNRGAEVLTPVNAPQ